MNSKDSHKRLSFSHQEDVSQQRNGNGTGQNHDHVFVPADSVLLTVDEVAEILRVPRSWVYSHQDQLPTVRLGRYVRFRRSEIELFLDQQKAC
jgi:excisionase family DNA binding protein